MTHRRAGGGRKRSSWPTLRRRLALIRCLLRGPATRERLWEAGQQALGDEAWGDAPAAALRHDLHALRREFGCVIRFHARTGYVLEDLGELALLDLPDDLLAAVPLLQALADTLPAQLGGEITQLLEHLNGALPPERRLPPRRAPPAFWGPRSPAAIDPTLLHRVSRALGHQQLQFRYTSSYSTAPEGVAHRVAPYGLLMRDGHLYLDADSLWADSPDWRARRLLFRLDRIVPQTLHILPAVVPPARLPRPQYALRYVLAPAVARQRDVAQHFAGGQTVYHDDGSATVTATIDDLWHARQTLLLYGGHCRVEAPPALVELMRHTISELATAYQMRTFVDGDPCYAQKQDDQDFGTNTEEPSRDQEGDDLA